MNRQVATVIRYGLTANEVKEAIKEYAKDKTPDNYDNPSIIPDFASVKLQADGGAVIESEYMDD